jgi:hypothetical protein
MKVIPARGLCLVSSKAIAKRQKFAVIKWQIHQVSFLAGVDLPFGMPPELVVPQGYCVTLQNSTIQHSLRPLSTHTAKSSTKTYSVFRRTLSFELLLVLAKQRANQSCFYLSVYCLFRFS